MSKPNIENSFKKLGDRKIAAHSARFFKTGKGEYGEGDLFLGIRVPIIRKQIKNYSDLTLSETIESLKSPYHEIRLFSVLLLVDKYKKADDKEKSRIYQLYLKNSKYINNWDIVDSSASYIVGDFLLNGDKSKLYQLAKSKNLWKRRISIIATFCFIKNHQYEDTLQLAKILLHDKEDLIHKAVGWMLREIGNRNIKIEEKFLKTHYHEMPRTMLRYAIEKFPETKRKAYLNGKI